MWHGFYKGQLKIVTEFGKMQINFAGKNLSKIQKTCSCLKWSGNGMFLYINILINWGSMVLHKEVYVIMGQKINSAS